MSESTFKLANPPIVEAVIDIECDMPSALDLAALENAARDRFREQYPKFRKQVLQEHRIEQKGDEPPQHSARSGLQAFQLLQNDELQLVQVRAQGFSFNRLAPYSALDDYMPEIKRTWDVFVGLIGPVQIRKIGLRYINRILLPAVSGKVKLEHYFKVSPQLPEAGNLAFAAFLNHHTAVEIDTGNQVNIILMMQPPETDKIPVIFDIEALYAGAADPSDWTGIESRIASLRSLKNRVFRNTLTDPCLNLFQ